MRQRLSRLVMVAAFGLVLAGCDKCADNFLVDPFAKPKPAACHGAPAPH